MCCFSRPVRLVADTNIFARAAKEGRQYLVYSMHISAVEDLAMILPIPTPPKSADNAVRFISFEKYPEFFADLRRGFPMPTPSRAGGRGPVKSEAHKTKLEVVSVGSFEASFVPSIGDFDRLDERFRLPSGVWDQLPQYKDYGFAVFKLKSGDSKVHPMAFEFPRARPGELFFPTVHIHDGTVKPRARFHHDLYCQKSAGENLMTWTESASLASQFVRKINLAQGVVDGDGHCYRREMRGVFANEDVKVAADA
jgi:hypothetical protein